MDERTLLAMQRGPLDVALSRGYLPVSGSAWYKPEDFKLPASGVGEWLSAHASAVYIGAGVLVLLALMRGRR